MLTGIAALHSGALAVANFAQGNAPEAVLSIWVRDPVSLAVVADQRLAERAGSGRSLQPAAVLARKSLRIQALNPRALRVLAITAEASRRPADAQRLIDVSLRLSRRDFGAQLWAIERAVAQNDVRGALAGYDLALRTNPEGQNVLLPILVTALADPEVSQAFGPYVRMPPPWLPALIGYAFAQGNAAATMSATIVRAGGLPSGAEFRGLETQGIARLIEDGEPLAARALFRSLPGARPEIVQRTDFSDVATDPRFVPLTWRFVSTPEFGSQLSQGDSATPSTLAVFAAPGQGGEVAAKVVFAVPGNYVFEATLVGEAPANDGSLTVVLSCASGKRSVLSNQNFRPAATVRISARLKVPADCPALWLSLVASGGSGAGLQAVLGAPWLRRESSTSP